ncbi:hypothetical protein BDQ12DRAFT_691115 [Crucibulum laeve]|uniref:Uncharacterized protein n=1 Tax=Crucibulum laeve TaxID=68775 RepID=A0A5C3LNA9_9AGAR|nr:hypothetical protein BDQ12DRAFT_691115 [Crucibulum laeve]
MRVSFAVIVVAAAAAVSNAAIIPRANMNSTIESRYYNDKVYVRHEEPRREPGVVHPGHGRALYRRNHPREFRVKRQA